MRIRALTPIDVDASELARRQRRYDRLAPPGVSVSLENVPGSPPELATSAQIRRSEEAGTTAMLSTAPGLFDAVLPDCVLDPGVDGAAGIEGIRVIGITRTTVHFLAGQGIRFGVLTRNEAIGAEYERVIGAYGLRDWFDGVHCLGLSVEDIADDEVWNGAVADAATRAAGRGVHVLVNGCSAVEVTVTGYRVRVIDPTALALRLIGIENELGRTTHE